MDKSLSKKPCDACGTSFMGEEWFNRHTPHEEDCPQKTGATTCTCNIDVHEECCWECNQQRQEHRNVNH